jgi:ribosomal protein S18 acetylase RimI-like enzyme
MKPPRVAMALSFVPCAKRPANKSGMQRFRFRELAAGDLPAIKQVDRLSFSAEEQYPSELYDSLLTGGVLRAIVVTGAAGAIAGYALLDVSRDPIRIRSLAVLPEQRNKGYGKALVQHLIETFDAPLELLVEKNNVGAIRLYERLGFGFVERDSHAELAATHHMFRRFKNASCLNEPPLPKRTTTERADGIT